MSARSTSRAGAWLRWSVTALALLAIALWASTWVVKVSEQHAVGLYHNGWINERSIYRGALWRFDHLAQPKATLPMSVGQSERAIRFVGLSAGPFPFVPGTVTTVTSSPLAGLFFAPAGAAAALWASWYIRRRMVRPGHCKACRYDLSAVPGDVCPECGGTGTRVQTADRCV